MVLNVSLSANCDEETTAVPSAVDIWIKSLFIGLLFKKLVLYEGY